jgi:GAF domain-containing protein
MATELNRISRYRQLLRRDIPSGTRCTLEWLLAGAARRNARLDPPSLPRRDLDGPQLIALADDAVEEAVSLVGAQFGNLQLYIAAHDMLLLVAHRNFNAEFLDQFACLTPDGRTACSRAIASGRRVIVADVANDELFAPHVPAALSAGFRAVQSTPLRGESGQVFGIVSTHFAGPRSFSNDELGRLDGQARRISSELARAWA